ncbi:MAG: DUF1588 domain-containing protein [Myxococcota bacterium]
MRRIRETTALLIGLGVSSFIGCAGDITGSGGPDGLEVPGVAGGPGDTSLDGSRTAFACDEAGERSTVRPLRRLSYWELTGSIERAFGENVLAAVEVPLESVQREGDTLNEGAFEQNTNREYLEAILRVFDAVGETAEAERSLERFHGCDSLDSSACREALVAGLGRRLFRRPLTDAQLLHFMQVLNEQGQRGLVVAMMLAPEFLFHLEHGDGPEVELDQFALASRLAFMIEDAIPDEPLLALAEAGALEGEVLRDEVSRLLRGARGRAKTTTFFERWLGVRVVPAADTTEAFLRGIDGESYVAEAAEELRRFVDYVVYEKEGTVADLLLGNESFATSEDLAEVLGAQPWNEGDEPEEAAIARGVLLRPPVLMNGYARTSPILRGVFLLRNVLCEELEFPGDDVISMREEQNPDPTAVTGREITAAQTSAPECAACHDAINPLGFAFEDLDSLGRFRTQEDHFVEGELVESYAIDSASTITIDGNSVDVSGSLELVDALAASDQVAACIARRYYTFAQFRTDLDNADQCHMARMFETLDGSGTILDLLHSAYLETILRTRRVNP